MSFYGRNFGLTMTSMALPAIVQHPLMFTPVTHTGAATAAPIIPEATFLAPQPESFMDQYGTLVIAGGAAVALLVLGFVLLKKPGVKKATAGYRRRRRR